MRWLKLFFQFGHCEGCGELACPLRRQGFWRCIIFGRTRVCAYCHNCMPEFYP